MAGQRLRAGGHGSKSSSILDIMIMSTSPLGIKDMAAREKWNGEDGCHRDLGMELSRICHKADRRRDQDQDHHRRASPQPRDAG